MSDADLPPDPETADLYQPVLTRYVLTLRLIKVGSPRAVGDTIRTLVARLGAVHPVVGLMQLGNITPRADKMYQASAEVLTREFLEQLPGDMRGLAQEALRAAYGAGWAAHGADTGE